jgi:hypothetical protein
MLCITLETDGIQNEPYIWDIFVAKREHTEHMSIIGEYTVNWYILYS